MSLKNELTTPKSINTLKNDVYVLHEELKQQKKSMQMRLPGD